MGCKEANFRLVKNKKTNVFITARNGETRIRGTRSEARRQRAEDSRQLAAES